ncbi:MAG: XRE family transcriptional regulator [Helicobacteraceae bacterium]|nr:XRE family transcriptional regulator [Helicobacteraceae bacterium]
MELYERINTILKLKKLNKKEFALKLIDLSPKLKRTGETPTLTTIYSYLNGNREVQVELISYIAEVLDISEQELFEHSSEPYEVETASMLKYAPKSIVMKIQEKLEPYKRIHDELDKEI